VFPSIQSIDIWLPFLFFFFHIFKFRFFFLCVTKNYTATHQLYNLRFIDLNVAVPCPAAQSRLAILDGMDGATFFPDRGKRDSSRETRSEAPYTIYPYRNIFRNIFSIER
jgi:hypothetical protein